MPQYDAYEDVPPPHSPALERRSPSTSTAKLSTAKLSTRKPSTPLVDIPGSGNIERVSSQTTPFHSPLEFHRRHSLLSRAVSQEESAIESVSSPEPATAMSPKNLSAKEKAQLAELERSQQEDDAIRLAYESERGRDREADQASPAVQRCLKEEHVVDGVWMRRSRANSELLNGRI